ncbi:MAG: HDIG domain-containing protein [Candidatus Hydrogenedentes bacterium]|nr:HDIG domain-containing protein [Candidatus Hydrogenedentota bacterium]
MAVRTPQKKRRSRLFPFSQKGKRRAAARTRWINGAVTAAAFVCIVAAVTRFSHRDPMIDVLENEIDTQLSSREIRAAFDFETVDLEPTQRAQEEAMAKVPDYYRVDESRVDAQLRALREQIDALKKQRPLVEALVTEALSAPEAAQNPEDAVTKAVHQFARTLQSDPDYKLLMDEHALAQWLMPDKDSLPRPIAPKPAADDTAPGDGAADQPEDQKREADAPEVAAPLMLTFHQSDILGKLAEEGLSAALRSGVRPENLQRGEGEKAIAVLRETATEDGRATAETRFEDIIDPAGAREYLETCLSELSKNVAGGSEWGALSDATLPLAAAFITDTLQFDGAYTESARERVRATVEPVKKKILASEKIQDGGSRWTAQSRSDAKVYLDLLRGDAHPLAQFVTSVLSNVILVALALACLHRAIVLFRGESTSSETTLFQLALLLICGLLILSRIAYYFEPTGFMVPVAACGILYAILANVGLAVMVSFVTAALVSAQYSYDWRLMIVGAAMSLAGAFSIVRVRRRSDMASASIAATLVGVFAMIAVILAMDKVADENTFRRLVLIGLNGSICLLAVPAVLSPLERLFGITTDIQLLEYSDFNNELLAQLAVEAPGTSAHSRMLGDLAEAAADAIGANGLLARVCALYHDIGKMRRSEYFSENQNGYNIHDELSPRMSARAIAAHVIQGAELAREYHLPKPIIDGIFEHHGTCLIGYFYQQALKQQKHGDVLEDDFRYPGPKPQRPETAILMICDAVESGVRSIKNPNEERVRDFVDKIVAARSADRQFDDCNLTLKQLDTIAEVVAQRIVSNLHTRVAYPSMREEKKVDNVIPMAGKME